MLSQSRIMAFCATAKPEEAKRFYQSVLGLPLVEDSPFAIVFDCNGVELRVQKVPHVAPGTHTTLGWSVTSIESQIRELAAAGVVFEKFPGLQQDQHGIWVAPNGAKIAWFRDPDGNILSLAERA